jgi:protein MpaA
MGSGQGSRREAVKAIHVLSTHRAHDYRHLINRWRQVARASGLIMRPYISEFGYRLYCLRSPNIPANGAIYISAGIHGDEPAGTDALLGWAEMNLPVLRRMPFLIFPCLNPWGLVNNTRFDAAYRDLNRSFQNDEVPSIRALKGMLAGRRFRLALTLHEDFDGQGLYIYEIERVKPFWGEDLLRIAAPLIPIEGRTTIDGRRANSGIVRRRLILKKFATMGFPEAVYLHLHHSDRTFTIETPSEFALDQRVSAQIAIIQECVRRVCH